MSTTRNLVGRLPTTGRIGLAIVGIVALFALISLVWTPQPPTLAVAAERLQGPSWDHLLGTDRFGRDVLSRLMVGAGITLGVGLIAVTIAALIGVPLGIAAGMHRGGALDAVLMRGADLLLAFPALLLAIIAGAVWGPSTVTAMIAIGVAGIPSFMRLARAGTLQIIHQDYIAAARLSQVPGPVIAWRHIMPNISSVIVVEASIYFALAILAEAALSYLGLGTPPPAASWGRMLHDAQSFLATDPWLAIFPGAAIALTVLGFNLLGDGLRDAMDARLDKERQAVA